jgi:hypothetical protein
MLTTRRESDNGPLDRTSSSRHDRSSRRRKALPAHLTRHGRPPAHRHAGRVDASTVGAGSSAGEASSIASKSSTTSSYKPLLVRP